MKRFVTTLLGAGLAVLVAGSAKAELLRLNRVVTPTTLTHTVGPTTATVTFTTPPGDSPPAPNYLDTSEPGSNATLLNYLLTTTGGSDVVTFNDVFSLTVDFTSYGPGANGQTFTQVFNGTVNGTLGNGQNNLAIDFTPQNLDFNIGGVPMKMDTYLSARGLLNDPNSQGAISVRLVSPVPEPGSMALLAIGGLPFLGMIRRRRK